MRTEISFRGVIIIEKHATLVPSPSTSSRLTFTSSRHLLSLLLLFAESFS